MKINDKKDINSQIDQLRLKLNRAYEAQGHTEKVVKLSQELDKYILSEQQKSLKRKNK
ncbi:aspartyl-phosphate phosphatase Spo0E family protein [Maledivibacter halophilus]|uniref:Spo0E like sporulation regulatory protein n=1 Tax=Maledivibacter halophilus TaxID=36842 RepID=A0A1T5IQC2_9FIRM|nr:aspartyl-phosphate phosphatase Spo0E family protein [Maledivibacter halophilus]SKC41198.1 Spo0E like sporulation regulatory protein [Maledivibacter halophilus]